MFLRIAPFQRWNVQLSALTLHDPRGYDPNGVLRLEAVMRLGAALGSCPETTGGSFYRYSMRITLDYKSTSTGLDRQFTVAPDLTAGEAPVPFPADVDGTKNASIGVRVRRQTCSGAGLKRFTCSTAAQISKKMTYLAKVIPRGSYFYGIDYEKTVFDLDDDDTTSFRPAKLDGFHVETYSDSIPPPAHPEAEGYVITGNKSSKPTIFPILPGTVFAVSNTDFWSPGVPYEEIGVDHAAGVRWPRVKGTRHGKPFWYTARAPKLVRDALDFCSPSSSDTSFYRLPWKAGRNRLVGQGNNTNFTHKGAAGWAFDFSLHNGQRIRAARGGEVTHVEESNSKNSHPDLVKMYNFPVFPANALRIEHQDGKASWYFHMQKNGVLVAEGDKVTRSTKVGITGNTGFSTNPHLHYQVNFEPSSGANSVPLRFQVIENFIQESQKKHTKCYRPKKGEGLISNNR